MLLCLLSFSSCGARMKLSFEKGNLISKDDVKYTPVQLLSYKPRTYVLDDKFATLDHPIYGKVNVYEVEGTNGGWIYCPTDDTLYRISSVAVPTLKMMAPTSAIVSTMGTREIAVASITDKEFINRITALIEEKEKYAVPDNELRASEAYKLSLISENYPHLVYTISYLEYSDGTYRIYDRDLECYYEIGSEIHDILNPPIEGTSGIETTTSPSGTGSAES